MKRVFVILLAALLLFCGAGAAASSLTTLSVDVFDTSDGNKAVGGASVVLVGATSSTLYTTSSGTAETPHSRTYGIGNSKVQSVRINIVPVFGCMEMAKRIFIVMRCNFRISRSSRGKIHKHCIITAGGIFSTLKVRAEALVFLIKIFPAIFRLYPQ